MGGEARHEKRVYGEWPRNASMLPFVGELAASHDLEIRASIVLLLHAGCAGDRIRKTRGAWFCFCVCIFCCTLVRSWCVESLVRLSFGRWRDRRAPATVTVIRWM